MFQLSINVILVHVFKYYSNLQVLEHFTSYFFFLYVGVEHGQTIRLKVGKQELFVTLQVSPDIDNQNVQIPLSIIFLAVIVKK